jgi:hypothetical protein
MITKILFTLAVAAIVYLAFKTRLRRPPAPARGAYLPPKRDRSATPLPRIAAWSLVALMLLASAAFLYSEWREAYRVVNVRVINSDTGAARSYQARLKDVEGRSFQTLDGTVVTLADVESMEVGGPAD